MEATIEKSQAILQAVEVMATVIDSRNLKLDAPLPSGFTGHVRVIVLLEPIPTRTSPVTPPDKNDAPV